MTDILVCLHDFSQGGTERIAIGLSKSWSEMGRKVAILCGSELGALRDTVDPATSVIALEPPLARSPFSRLWLGKAMAGRAAALQPKVIFLPGNFHLPLARPLHAAVPGAKIVMKVSNPPLPGGIANLVVGPLFRQFARSVDGFAALSNNFAEETGRLAVGKPVRVLHDPIYLRDAAPAARHEGVCNILWAGRLEPQKDVSLALETLKMLKEPAHLTILGDGSLRSDTEKQIKRLQLGNRVTLAGAVPAIDPWLASSDVLLLTSRYEGQPAVVGEALARGVPVVATDCASTLCDMIAIPEAGRVVAAPDPRLLAQAIAEVSRVPRPSREILRALVAAYSPQACAQAYLDFFGSLTGSRHVG